MQISDWNRAAKTDFFRRYMGAVFPVMEGDQKRELILRGCEQFLGERLTLSPTKGLAIRPGLFLNIEEASRGSADFEKIRGFLLEALIEKLRS
ncbi:MAG TPA: hypothetical protein VGQ81_13015 [Acidobacteriota bacterium]|jgi:hypothetical protein|nr:hypothetical protein [Acidobacteriota bacterium]